MVKIISASYTYFVFTMSTPPGLPFTALEFFPNVWTPSFELSLLTPSAMLAHRFQLKYCKPPTSVLNSFLAGKYEVSPLTMIQSIYGTPVKITVKQVPEKYNTTVVFEYKGNYQYLHDLTEHDNLDQIDLLLEDWLDEQLAWENREGKV